MVAVPHGTSKHLVAMQIILTITPNNVAECGNSYANWPLSP